MKNKNFDNFKKGKDKVTWVVQKRFVSTIKTVGFTTCDNLFFKVPIQDIVYWGDLTVAHDNKSHMFTIKNTLDSILVSNIVTFDKQNKANLIFQNASDFFRENTKEKTVRMFTPIDQEKFEVYNYSDDPLSDQMIIGDEDEYFRVFVDDWVYKEVCDEIKKFDHSETIKKPKGAITEEIISEDE